MPSIDDIAAEYVERAAALDPFYATYAGIAGHGTGHNLTKREWRSRLPPADLPRMVPPWPACQK